MSHTHTPWSEVRERRMAEMEQELRAQGILEALAAHEPVRRLGIQLCMNCEVAGLEEVCWVCGENW